MSQRNIDVSPQVESPWVQAARDDDHSVEACTLMDVIDRVSGKWAIGIMVAAARGPIRFTELERAVSGISRRMLTLTLRNLERDGLIRRTVYPVVPPKVEYTLTPIAEDLYESLASLTSWAERNRVAIAEARVEYDARADE
ncbi:winged helix-turn-helix transcriptional regulator [Spiractinospora alimapuensis]|uniref:winged helix-turn-helix transcriptional regulator n=1 Tax=Spiractinospora alimapuensis TaxID=2820884 RepID=UPI002ED2837A